MKYITFILFICFIGIGLSQKRDKLPSYFGLQFKPIIPGDFLSKSVIKINDTAFSGTFSQQYSYSFGASIRVGLTKLISIETGINQVKKNYKVDFDLSDSTITGQTRFGIISYDIPINAMIYIQLSDKIFSNASLGTSFVNYPSNVGGTVISNSKHLFVAEARRIRRFDFELNANLGFEFRSEKNGIFYLGSSAKIPFAPILKVAASYEYGNTLEKLAVGEVNGSYLSIDLRYFFPIIKSKGQQFNTGPIIN